MKKDMRIFDIEAAFEMAHGPFQNVGEDGFRTVVVEENVYQHYDDEENLIGRSELLMGGSIATFPNNTSLSR